MTDKLDRYHAKRDFSRTGEPAGGTNARHRRDDPHFVIQHHLATADHYDVRLEIDGVLVSWAVPKGPSTDPRERRLAKRTEDHPLDYEDFEGVIGRGQYGGGTVQVWDNGTYRNLTERDGDPVAAGDALTDGHLTVELAGHKLTGAWTFLRTRDDRTWLMIKKRDDQADARRRPTSTQPESVLTGRTMEQIAADAHE